MTVEHLYAQYCVLYELFHLMLTGTLLPLPPHTQEEKGLEKMK